MFVEGMYQSAIARVMKKNYNTVHSHIYRESKKAEEIMKKREDRIKEKRVKIISLDEMWFTPQIEDLWFIPQIGDL